jgi:APA family basic amino acid/polyamine antiporter
MTKSNAAVGQSESVPESSRKMGFWKCWAMSVGVMIGSGVFLLPSVLAPYGSISFLGWLLTSAGAIVIALVLGRLASRTDRAGGFYIYAQDAFGDLTGFMMAWGYWLSIVFAITAIVTVFSGYLGSLIPELGETTGRQTMTAAVLIWTLTIINIRGVNSGATLQLITTLLKLLPLLAIIFLGLAQGSTDNIPPFNPKELSIFGALAATALLTMWAFIGIEAGVVAADDVIDPKRTIPRAVVIGTISVALVYIAATAAVMMLVPVEILANSEAPFVDAAKGFGKFGAPLIAIGAIISAAGSANGNILLGGQMPMAVALDGLAPKFLARRNKGHSPASALLITAILSTGLLIFNLNEGLVAAFTFLISMSTLCTLLPYAVSAMADFKYSWKSAKAWSAIAVLAFAYACVAMIGSGFTVLLWGFVLLLAGLPIYFACKAKRD